MEKGYKNFLQVENLLDFSCNEECIVLSPHKSKENKPAITLHIPGNPCNADFYGKEKTLNISNAILFYRIYKETYKLLEKSNMPLTYEADHHGPTIERPIMFYELGATETEWNNEHFHSLMANALENAFDSNEMPKIIALYFGGNHYASMCNKLTRNNDYAFSHIIAKYCLDCLTKDVFKQAVEKCLQKIDIVLIEKNGTTKEQKEKIISFANELGLEYKVV